MKKEILRCGIIVEVLKVRKDGNILVRVVGRLQRNKASRNPMWQIGQERLLAKGGSGHSWGRDYDIIDAI
jgi:hypothetical protein